MMHSVSQPLEQDLKECQNPSSFMLNPLASSVDEAGMFLKEEGGETRGEVVNSSANHVSGNGHSPFATENRASSNNSMAGDSVMHGEEMSWLDVGLELPIDASIEREEPVNVKQEIIPQTKITEHPKVEPTVLIVGAAAKSSDGANKSEDDQNGSKGKNSNGKRKMKVDWTPELHRRFVQAVEQLGVEKAIPSRILELMNVQGLTRHNIASHLQKYRSHRRHLIAREAEAASWHHRRPSDPALWSRTTNHPPIQPRPAVGLPPLQPHPSSLGHPVPLPCPPSHASPVVGMPLYVWGHPTVDHSPGHMWQQPPMAMPPAYYAPDGSMWQYPAPQVSPVPGTPCYGAPPVMGRAGPPVVCGTPALSGAASGVTQATSGFDGLLGDEGFSDGPYSSLSDDLDLIIDSNDDLLNFGEDSSMSGLEEAINEALANPKTPPPLGLKAPEADHVVAELEKQRTFGEDETSTDLFLSSTSSLDTLVSCVTADGEKDCSEFLA